MPPLADQGEVSWQRHDGGDQNFCLRNFPRVRLLSLLPAPKIISGSDCGLALRPIGRERCLYHLDAAIADPSGIGGLPAAFLVHRLTAFLLVFYPASRRPLPAWRPSIHWPGHPPGSLELLLLSGTCHHILCRFGSRLLHHGIDRTLA